MQKLCDMTCSACRGDAEPLTPEQIQPYLQQVPAWSVVDAHHLTRTSRFKDFAGALALVNRVGELAERLGHHPIITFTWGRVTIEIFTHKIDGLHENDFILAAQIDQLG